MRRRRQLDPLLVGLVLTVAPIAAPATRAAAQEPPAAQNATPAQDDAAKLNEEAVALFGAGRYMEAEGIARRALEASRQAFGNEHPETLVALNNLALIHQELGRFGAAEPLFRQGLAASERVLGSDHPNTLTALNNLAGIEEKLGRFESAEQLLRRALAARERGLGPDHLDTLSTLVNLAGIVAHRGRPGEAEPLYRRVLSGWKQAQHGSAHPIRLTALSSLGALLVDQGRYAEAEPLFREAVAAHEQAFGSDHPSTLGVLSGFASLYRAQERAGEAEALYRRAIDAGERSLGADHPTVLIFVNNLASLYQDQKRWVEAEPLRLRTLAAHERDRGPDHPLTIASANNLATLYLDMGRTDAAEPLVRRALAAVERALGPEHPDTLTSLANLGGLYRQQGRDEQAAPLFRRAFEVRTRLLGREHPSTIETAELLVLAGLTRSDKPVAELAAARSMVAGLAARQNLADQDPQARAQRDREASGASARFALFGDAAWEAGAASDERRQALLPEVFAAMQRSIAGPADRSIGEQAARRYAAGRSSALGPLIAERQRLETQWSMLDDHLAASYADRAAQGAQAGVAPGELLAALGRIQSRIGEIDARLRIEAPEYFALIRPEPVDLEATRTLLKGEEAVLLVVPGPLGTQVVAVTRERVHWHRSQLTAALVRGAVQSLRWDAGARVSGSDEELAALGETKPEAALPLFDRKMAHLLYRELIAPALPAIGGTKRLFIAAGGSLAGLPFSLLVSAPPTGSDGEAADLRATRWFGDDFALTHIPSIRSLAILRGQRRAQAGGQRFIGIGNPLLSTATQDRRYGTRGAGTQVEQLFAGGRTRNGTPADLRQIRAMASLPGTAEELRLVSEALRAPASSIVQGAAATEGNVRALDFTNAGVVLFSTHGLTSEEATGAGEPGLVLTPPAAPAQGEEEEAQVDPGEDGYLAASEVTTLRMNADWVILSACNTATGDDNANLSSLARAFFYAGARNLLASHWPVSDEVAPLLITRTVAPPHRGTSRAAALQAAMRSIREDPRRPQWAHPFYWAPFVLIGDGE